MDLSKIFMQTLPNLKILISFERLADLWDQKQFLKQASGLGIQKANYLKKKKRVSQISTHFGTYQSL